MYRSNLSVDLALRDLLEATNRLRETVLNLSELVIADKQPRTVTVQDMSTASGLSIETVKKNIREGKLPGQLIGSRYVIPDLEFDAWRRGQWEPRREPIPSTKDFVHRRSIGDVEHDEKSS